MSDEARIRSRVSKITQCMPGFSFKGHWRWSWGPGRGFRSAGDGISGLEDWYCPWRGFTSPCGELVWSLKRFQESLRFPGSLGKMFLHDPWCVPGILQGFSWRASWSCWGGLKDPWENVLDESYITLKGVSTALAGAFSLVLLRFQVSSRYQISLSWPE